MASCSDCFCCAGPICPAFGARMSTITLLFHHDPTDWISRIMAWATHGRHTHVALLSPTGRLVIEASAVGWPKGVRCIPTPVWKQRHPGHIEQTVPHPAPLAVWNHASTQIGKAYDWPYIWGWVLRRKWQHPQRWTCHELIAWACQKAGHPIINMDEPHWLTPQHLYLISQPLE